MKIDSAQEGTCQTEKLVRTKSSDEWAILFLK